MMDAQLQCDFYFGKNLKGSIIKPIDYGELKGYKGSFTNIFYKGKIIWQKNTLRLLLSSYSCYIFSLQKACVSQILLMFLCRVFGKKVYLWTHGWYGNELKGIILYKKLLFLPVNGFFLYSHYAKHLMIDEGFSPTKLHVIANSFNYDSHARLRSVLQFTGLYAHHFGNENPVVIFIGRLEKGKQLEHVLYLCTEMKNHHPVNCVFIGDGVERERLESLSVELDIKDYVWFYGACYDEKEKSQLIFNATLCLSPGNVGLTCIDCLAYGTPVITHDDRARQMPEFEAITKGMNGDFFKYGDWDDMRRVVENWLSVHPKKTEEIMAACYKPIDTVYNPYYQIDVIKGAIE